MTEKITASTRKDVIFNAYQEALKTIENLKAQKYDPQSEKAVKERKEQVQKGEAAASSDLVKTIETITATLQSEAARIVTAHQEAAVNLENINSATLLKKLELEELYELEVGIDSLAAIINAQDETKAKFAQEHAEQLEKNNQELAAIKEQIQSARREYNQSLTDFNKELALEKKRKTEEFEYEFKRSKQAKEDELADELAAKRKEMSAEKEALDKREEELKACEENIENLQGEIANIPSKIASAVAKAVKEAEERLNATHNLEIAKLTAESDSKISILENKVTVLTETLETEREAHKDTAAKLETAYGRMEKVATASVEGARTEEAVNRVLSTMNDNGKK